MRTRLFPALAHDVSVIGLGTWQLGADWGDVSDTDAADTLTAAVNAGVTFIDTADVYGDGESERRIAHWRSANPDADVVVATKTGRRASPHDAARYSESAIREWVDRSRANLDVDTLDLVQLHCPPQEIYADDRVFDIMRALVAEGVTRTWGVSVETVAQGLAAIEQEGCASLQVIVNALRLKPTQELLPAAHERGVAIIARVPLASGLLTGKITADTKFGADDHRNYNRNGEAFDVGETFSGVPFDIGLAAAARITAAVPDGVTPAQAALAWLAAQPAVTTVIPGARNPEQARANAAAADIDLPASYDATVREVYDELVREHVHGRW
jgi:aryl-alcohol dehydrogenase-like predicted oxidoreductase